MISLRSSMSHTSGYCDVIALNISSVQDIRLEGLTRQSYDSEMKDEKKFSGIF